MSVPQSVAEILNQHVTFELECIDRMYLNVYVPPLQCESGVVKFFRSHRGHPFASSALMDPMTMSFVAGMERFARQEQIPVVQFHKGQRKDDVMAEHLARFDKPEGVVMLGKAQEKTPVFRTQKRRNPETGKTYPWIVRSTAMVNQYYWYCLDRDFGPFFLKFASYFPYNAKLCLNGHEYAKCQLRREGIGFKALDNGFVSCDNPERLQTICEEMGPQQSTACCAAGWRGCRTRSPRRTAKPATATTFRFCRLNFLLRRFWTGRCMVASCSRKLSGRTSTSAGRTWCS